MDLRWRRVVPDNPHFFQSGAEPDQMPEESDVEGEAVDGETIRNLSRQIAAQQLEAALRIVEIGQTHESQQTVVAFSEELTERRLAPPDSRVFDGPASDHDICLLGMPQEEWKALDGRREIGICEQDLCSSRGFDSRPLSGTFSALALVPERSQLLCLEARSDLRRLVRAPVVHKKNLEATSVGAKELVDSPE